MAPLHVLILSTLPLCLAQFSIQGPSDGNRAAQSLRYSEEKGIEYSDQSASLGTGDFSIQGATDGNSNFQIQGASDGNSDFQIQGATDSNADFRIQGASDGNSNFHIQGASDGNADFQIQGATDGNANFQIQGATDGQANYQVQEPSSGNEQSSIQLGQYDANQGSQRSLQYNNPNGFKLNWKSYAHGQLSPQLQQQRPQPEPVRYTQSQAETQYATRPAPRPAPQPAPQPTHQGEERVSVQQPISYRPFDNAPAQIKQLLQFQSQIPYLNAIPEHLRYDAIAYAQPQTSAPEQPQEDPRPSRYRPDPRGHQRPKRQAQKHQGQQQQHRRIPQPSPEATPQYSSNVPSQIQQLLNFQSQIPYQNAIPEQFRYNLDTPPAPVQPFKTEVPLQNAPRIGHARSKRQTHHQQHQNQQQQPQQQYRRIPQPALEPQPHYSTNVPSQIQQLLRFQSQIPYMNAIPEQFRYNLENVPAQNPQQGAHQRGKRQAQHQQKPQQQYRRISQPAPESQPQYSTNVPPQIKQLLQFQSQIPYVNAIPEQFRYNLENVQHAPQNGAQSHQRGKREAQQHLQGENQQQYKRIPHPVPEALPQYSANLPPGIQQILKFQAETPYNIIANQIIYRPDKPYVPQPVSLPMPNYQAQTQGNIKPVTERQ
ncbi:uncharacterized protein [Neodiprion pinetum]|uniref:uncharacterized protein n=1 Tax=Neodiprion pinetum TaxID=441929 RepID=UPI001EDDDCA7|nr:putative mediator of RNA polymerase II transcription subunit 12 [Neodiprion pinetum]